jgi:hypothetical protein
LPNKKNTRQKEVNNKIHIAYSDLYRKSLRNSDSPENLSQYRQIPLESSGKFQLNPTFGFGVVLNSVNWTVENFMPKSESDLAWFVSQG